MGGGFKKNNPGCNCCGATACSFCTSGTTPETISVTISGVTDSYCDACSTLDGTYVLTKTAADPCVWDYSTPIFTQQCGVYNPPSSRSWYLKIFATLSGGWQFEIGSVGLADAIYTLSLASPFDCSVARTLNRTQQGTACSFPSTVTITPA